jgi:hypothetical protein
VQAGKIRILGGSLAGTEVLVSARVILGRDPVKAQIVFPSRDTAVSRQHCEIRFDSAHTLFEVRDLGSRNGTFIDNSSDPPRRLTPDVAERLPPGQSILVGSSHNRLVLELDRMNDAAGGPARYPPPNVAKRAKFVSASIALVGIVVLALATTWVLLAIGEASATIKLRKYGAEFTFGGTCGLFIGLITVFVQKLKVLLQIVSSIVVIPVIVNTYRVITEHVIPPHPSKSSDLWMLAPSPRPPADISIWPSLLAFAVMISVIIIMIWFAFRRWRVRIWTAE